MKRKWLIALGVGFALSLGTEVPGFAATTPTSQLEDIVVTADRVKTSRREVTTNVMIIDRETIESSSANDLGDLLAEQGFQTRVYPGTNTVTGIRGYRSDSHGNDMAGRVLLLLNGRRIGTGNAAIFSLANVERIEIIRGPASTQYGAAALGGLVNVITKQGTDDGGPFAASVEGGIGSFDAYKGRVNMAVNKAGFDASLGYKYYQRGDYTDGGGNRYVNTEIDGSNALNIDAGYTFAEIHRVGVNVNYYGTNDAYSPGNKLTATTYDVTNKSNINGSLNYAGSTQDKKFSWMLNGALGKDTRNYDTHRYSTGLKTSDSKYTVDSQSAQAQVSYNQKYLLITAGFDYLNYDMEDISTKSDYRNWAGFLLGKIRLFDEKLIISSGVRYDDFNLEGETQGLSTKEKNWSPSVGLAYNPANWLKLRAHYAQGFVMPSASYIFGDDRYYIPNLNLKPEKNDTYEAGFDIVWHALDFNFTYFYSIGTDAFKAERQTSGKYLYTNIDKSRRQGLEVGIGGDIAKAVGWSAVELRPFMNLTWMLEYEGRDTPSSPYKKLTFVPDLTVGYGLRFAYPKGGFTTSLNCSYFGEEWISDTKTNGKFTTVSWTARKELMNFDKFGKLTLRAEVNNLFDKEYAYVDGYPMPGRNFYLGVIYAY